MENSNPQKSPVVGKNEGLQNKDLHPSSCTKGNTNQQFMQGGGRLNQTSKTNKPCLDMTRKFLKALAPNTKKFLFAVINENKNKKGSIKHTWGTLDEHMDELTHLNRQGYGIFVCVNETSGKRRQAQDVTSVRALFVDDDKGIVNAEKHLKPHIVVKSSGEKRHFYWLTDNVTPADFKDISGIWVNMHEGADPQVKDITRILRLPGFYHMKKEPQLVALLEVRDHARYQKSDFQKHIDLHQPATKKRKNKQTSETNDAYPIFTPASEVNSVIEKLKETKLYRREISKGKHDITCPWVHEHTDGIDNGAAYLEPSDEFPEGGFKCHHAHCEERYLGDLLSYLKLGLFHPKGKPTIVDYAGKNDVVQDYVEQTLSELNVFHRGTGICTISDIRGQVKIQPLTADSDINKILSKNFHWRRPNKKGVSTTNPPAHVIRALKEGTMFKHLSYLKGLAYQPYLYQGEWVSISGYHEGSELYGAFGNDDYNIPSAPSKEEAQQALGRLRKLIGEFPFNTKIDEACALCAIFTAALRSGLPQAPMILVRAPMPGTGKSFLCQLISHFAYVNEIPTQSLSSDYNELEKALLSTLMQGTPVINFDNVINDIDASKSLCSILTAPYWEGRILGSSRMVKVGTQALFLASGNNIRLKRDMTRRCLPITLNARTEKPAERRFASNPISTMDEQRSSFVNDVFTIIQAYRVTKNKVNLRPLNGYGEWTKRCREPLVWLGVPDPAEAIFDEMSNDPEHSQLKTLLESIYVLQKNKCFKSQDLINLSAFSAPSETIKVSGDDVFTESNHSHGSAIQEIILDVAGELNNKVNRRRLGKWLSRQEEKIAGNFVLKARKGNSASKQWHVERISSESNNQ